MTVPVTQCDISTCELSGSLVVFGTKKGGIRPMRYRTTSNFKLVIWDLFIFGTELGR